MTPWLICYHAALVGILSAQRKMPNPDLVVRLAVTIANAAVEAMPKERRRTKAGKKGGA